MAYFFTANVDGRDDGQRHNRQFGRHQNTPINFIFYSTLTRKKKHEPLLEGKSSLQLPIHMIAKSIKGNSVVEIKEALKRSMADARLPDGDV